ncbi:MAG TPA: EAL domain-containing protein [Rhodocyclaceae bacterium]|jgi:diguanylate cyclase (GGDEF)-like protein/PAS domain S-box-containing protein
MKYSDLVDIPRLQELMESFTEVTGIANAVIDVDGTVIVKAGWQEACTDFHRVNADSCRRCIESDTSLVKSMTSGKSHAVYQCHNGLVDTAAPIVVDGQHVANVFTGQFFTAEPDLDFFRRQAAHYHFDEERYLAAITRVPIVAKEQVESITRLYAQLAAILANNGLDRRKTIQASEKLASLNKSLEETVAQRTRDLMASNEDLAGRELLLKQILDTSSVAIFLVDRDGYITQANQRMAEMFACSVEDLLGSEYVDLIHPSERNLGRQKMKALLNSSVSSAEVDRLYWRADHSEFWGNLTGRRFHDPRGKEQGLIGVIADITERKQAESKIQELAFFDQLTNLPNRTLLYDRLRQAMIAGVRNGNFGALLLIDLDNFKTLNDTHGHDMGDLLLKQVAQRLVQCVRAEDTVARLGGDEFVVMLVNLSPLETEAVTQVEAIGEKVLTILNQTYQLKDTAYLSSPSIGATLFRGQLIAIDDLLKQADMAMYRAKDAGRNAMRFFDPAMQTAVVARADMEAGLRQGLEQHQFLLHYQPQVVDDGRVTGAEALVRWQHPERGMVSPAEFIPLAENTGLILPLGQWVLETACHQLARWAGHPQMDHLTIAVNVSAHQFRQPDFVQQVAAVLKKTGANPERLKLELTESLLVDNVQDIIEKMFALKAKGIGFSLDDFGTGYSSLAYLKRLPLDQLKIDQSFVRDVLSDPNDAAIAKTVVALAQSLGLGVIAEGVETDAQRSFLASAGCYAYQGYFFSRPLPIESFEKFALGV